MPAISFTVTRVGDLTRDGAVNWTLEGDVPDASLVANQAKSGLLNWAANDATSRTITITTVGNTADNADRTCRVRLSNPSNAVLGVDNATTTIFDDDAATMLSYDENLPYGGTLLGAACQDGEAGNTFIRNDPGGYGVNHAVVMGLESLLPIVAIATENRIDHFPLGSTDGGYSDRTIVKVRSSGVTRPAVGGDNTVDGPNTTTLVDVVSRAVGGDIRWRVARVNLAATSIAQLVFDKDANGNVIYAGETERIIRCGRDQSWIDQWVRCGGSASDTVPSDFGGSNIQGGIPTIWFKTPINPKTLGWAIGDRIAYIIDSTAPDTGSTPTAADNIAPNNRRSSINYAFRRERPSAGAVSTYPLHKFTGAWWGNFNHQGEYYPCFAVGHRRPDNSLLVKGNAYLAWAGDPNVYISGAFQLRQAIRIPNGFTGRKLSGCDCTVFRGGGTGSGSFIISLRKAGQTLRTPSSDDGTEIARTVVNMTSLTDSGWANNRITNTKFNFPAGADPHRNVAIASADRPTVTAGETYYIQFSCTGNAHYAVQNMLNFLDRPARGLKSPDHINTADRYQSRAGATGNWATITEHFASDYLHLGCALFFTI